MSTLAIGPLLVACKAYFFLSPFFSLCIYILSRSGGALRGCLGATLVHFVILRLGKSLSLIQAAHRELSKLHRWGGLKIQRKIGQ